MVDYKKLLGLQSVTPFYDVAYPYEKILRQIDANKLFVLKRRQPMSGQFLTVIGGEHVSDPDFWHYKPGSALFHVWRRQTTGRERIILCEGPRSAHAKTAKESIARFFSERGLQSYWGDKYAIPVYSAEPQHFSDIHALLQEYPFDEVLCFLGMREIPVWHRLEPATRQPLEPYLDFVLQHFHKTLCQQYHDIAGKNYDFSYRNFAGIYARFMGEALAPCTVQKSNNCLVYTAAYAYPQIARLPVARVSVRSIVLRDLHIADTFSRHWNAGKDIFSWYGATHVLALQPQLAALGEPVDKDNEGLRIIRR